jgi:hypothetical protein
MIRQRDIHRVHQSAGEAFVVLIVGELRLHLILAAELLQLGEVLVSRAEEE